MKLHLSSDYQPGQPGKIYSGRQLTAQPQPKPGLWKRPWFRALLKYTFVLILLAMAGGAGAGYHYYQKYSADLPDVTALRHYKPSLVTRIYDNNGELAAEYYVERRILIPLESIPMRIRQATLAVEDSSFYEHPGINFEGILRAAWANYRAGRIVQGGSSINQQVAKSLLLSSEKTYTRKIREAILAVKMDDSFTKDEILELYLNHIYYGEGAYGVEAASQVYFGKSVDDLELQEIALIVGLPKAPSTNSPYTNLGKAVDRMSHVLRRMRDTGIISDGQMENAILTPLRLVGRKKPLNKALWFTEHIRRVLEEKFSAEGLYREGLTVRSTLDLAWQDWARAAIRDGLEKADKRLGFRGAAGFVDIEKDEKPDWKKLNPERAQHDYKEEYYTKGRVLKGVVTEVEKNKASVEFEDAQGVIPLENMKWAHSFNPDRDALWAADVNDCRKVVKKGDVLNVVVEKDMKIAQGPLPLSMFQEPDVQGSLLAMDPKTGFVKAMIGGYDSDKSSFNRATQAKRQPGSSFKPLIYAAALSKGYTPASVVVDSPIIFNRAITEFKGWKPMNFEQKFYGPTTLRTALTHSRNIVTIKLLEKITPQYVSKLAKEFGIYSPMDENLSLALGASPVSLEEMVTAYGVLSNLGVRRDPIYIKTIENRDGEVIYRAEITEANAIPTSQAYQLVSMMESVVASGTGRSLRSKIKGRPVAGKTGTTNDCVDAWFIGYTPDIVCGVWTGRDDNTALGRKETGARMAIPIWGNFMEKVFHQTPINGFTPPQDVVFVKINKETGLLSMATGENSIFEVFQDGAQPTKFDESGSAVETAVDEFKRGF